MQSMITATCHCGDVQVEVPRRPPSLTDCNCSICRRYGVLWAYYKEAEVHIHAKRGCTQKYSWGDKSLNFVRCGACGCVMYWKSIKRGQDNRMGVNARNWQPQDREGIRVRVLDGANTWKFLS
jgi:hypothetical protein